MRGADPGDLAVQVQPGGAGAVRFGLHITPGTIITAADAGGTVRLQEGEQFSVELQEGYAWTVSIADETIVGRVQDDQRTFEALQAGSTTLLVSGDPLCLHSRPACLIPSLSFEIQLVVV